MSEMEDKLNSLLSNPQLMQQIMSMAQTLGAGDNSASSPVQEPQSQSNPSLDPRLLQNILHAARQTGMDGNETALLHALSPYLSSGRLQKLERAMRAAKLAGAASLFLNAGGLQMLTGR